MFKHPPIPQWKEMLLGDQKSKLVPRQKDLVRRVGAFTQYIGFKLLRVTFCLTTRHSNWSSALSFLNGTAKATYFGLGYHRNMGHYRKVSQLNSRCYVKSMNFSCRMRLLNVEMKTGKVTHQDVLVLRITFFQEDWDSQRIDTIVVVYTKKNKASSGPGAPFSWGSISNKN